MNGQHHIQDRFCASILGGALGDALGYAVEFMGMEEIFTRYGVEGIQELDVHASNGKAFISDDTQMTLFTVDGLLRGAWLEQNRRATVDYPQEGLYPAYIRWLHTQGKPLPDQAMREWISRQPYETSGSIMDQAALFARRAPGNTCITALESMNRGTAAKPLNNSKGCGGVMRVAPIGLFFHQDPEKAFHVGAASALLTHGHPSGYLAAGALAAMIAELLNGAELVEGYQTAGELLKKERHHEETLEALVNAAALAQSNERPEEAIPLIGEGWVAEEALAIGLYCAMKRRSFRPALLLAVNHRGDSDSTGSICGNLLGAYGGMEVIPNEWILQVEMKDTILSMADRLYEAWVRRQSQGMG